MSLTKIAVPVKPLKRRIEVIRAIFNGVFSGYIGFKLDIASVIIMGKARMMDVASVNGRSLARRMATRDFLFWSLTNVAKGVRLSYFMTIY